jgi:hypothetical protein
MEAEAGSEPLRTRFCFHYSDLPPRLDCSAHVVCQNRDSQQEPLSDSTRLMATGWPANQACARRRNPEAVRAAMRPA